MKKSVAHSVNGAEKKNKPEKNRAAQAETVKKLLKKVEQKLGGEEVKASLGDYIRLMQLQRELEEESAQEIKVTWVEPEATGEKSE